METNGDNYGNYIEFIEKCPHTVKDENLGAIFCVRCGLETQEQTFHKGGYQSYMFRPTPKTRKVKRKPYDVPTYWQSIDDSRKESKISSVK